MRPEISYYIQNTVYDDLENDKTVENRPAINGVLKPVQFIDYGADTTIQEDRPKNAKDQTYKFNSLL